MVVLIFEKEMLVSAVDSKGNGGGAKARKSALEALGAGELASGTPGLAVFGKWGILALVIKLSSTKSTASKTCTHFLIQGSCSGTRAALRNSLMLNPVGFLGTARRTLSLLLEIAKLILVVVSATHRVTRMLVTAIAC